jgi:hypothetical protein
MRQYRTTGRLVGKMFLRRGRSCDKFDIESMGVFWLVVVRSRGFGVV